MWSEYRRFRLNELIKKHGGNTHTNYVQNQSGKQSMMSLIKSYFVPDSCLQGSEFPIHLLWDRTRHITIRIRFPSNMMHIKEVYNVPKEGVKIEEDTLTLKDFETNGYAGLVLGTKTLKEFSTLGSLEIEIIGDDGSRNGIQHNVVLFRPQITLYKTPNEIIAIQGKGDVILKDKIPIRNVGKGTAIVQLDISKESNVTVRVPEGMKEFYEKFISMLASKSIGIKKEFPEYSEAVDGLTGLLTDSLRGSVTVTEDYVKKMQDVLDKIDAAFEESENFMRSVMEAVLSAYLSSVHIITEVHGFLEYLKSLAKNRVLLLNATSVIELKPGTNRVSGYLRIQDLADNVYEPLKIDIAVNLNSSAPAQIALYAMFNWLE